MAFNFCSLHISSFCIMELHRRTARRSRLYKSRHHLINACGALSYYLYKIEDKCSTYCSNGLGRGLRSPTDIRPSRFKHEVSTNSTSPRLFFILVVLGGSAPPYDNYKLPILLLNYRTKFTSTIKIRCTGIWVVISVIFVVIRIPVIFHVLVSLQVFF